MNFQPNTDIFKPKWYLEQMRGWSFKTYMLLMLGIGVIIGTTISTPVNLISLITMVLMNPIISINLIVKTLLQN